MTNTDNIIDSRDIIDRIEELEEFIEGGVSSKEEYIAELESEIEELQEENPEDDRIVEIHEEIEEIQGDIEEIRSSEESEELAILKGVNEEGENYSSDWKYGETMIHDDYFEEYAQELAADLGDYRADQPWPMNCIDWEMAANELKMDYTSIDYDGVSYWVRSN